MQKYPLSKQEENKMDKVWEFIKIFRKPYIYITDYRNYLIKKIRKKYTPEEFQLYESIANKLLWNLRWVIAPLVVNSKLFREEYNNQLKSQIEIPLSLLKCTKIPYTTSEDLDKKLKNPDLYMNNYYSSFINKIIMVDENNHIIYHKLMEGSSHIFDKNKFNLLTFTILFNKKLYMEIMRDPYEIKNKDIELSEYYYQYDYGFPNLNLCTYNFNTLENQLYRIKQMYYDNKNGKYWVKLIL